MSVNNFIPVIWSARVLQALQKSLVYAQPQVVNRDYEGEIQDKGDTVVINSIGDPTIVNYVKNTPLPNPETLTDASRRLLIDAAKAFTFQVDDVDRRQALGNFMPEAMSRAGYRLKDQMDSYVAVKMAAGARWAIGTSASPVLIDNTAVYFYDQLVKARVLLDEANVPTDNRWAVIPAWAEAVLGLDARFVGVRGYDAPNKILMNGAIGQAAGFNLLKSNNVPSTPGSPPTRYQVLCGTADAFTLAEQINKVEALRSPTAFADVVRGLHLFGGSVVRPYELVLITANDTLGIAGAGPQDLPA